MARAKLSATCAGVLLSMTLVSAQTTRGRAPDSSRQNDSAATAPQTTTISGCVVRDAANEGRATIVVKGTSYALLGKQNNEFDRYLGKRVEVTGTVEPAPTDQTATAGQSDVPSTDAPRDNTTVPLKTRKGTTDDLTSRLHVRTVRIVSQSCLQQ